MNINNRSSGNLCAHCNKELYADDSEALHLRVCEVYKQMFNMNDNEKEFDQKGAMAKNSNFSEIPIPPAPAKKQLVGPVSLENDCTGDVMNDSQTLELPNSLQLVKSDLPVSVAENTHKLIGKFLFRQIVSPNGTNHKCLLCRSESTFDHLSDLEKHYSTIHELASQTFTAEFSENILACVVPPPEFIRRKRLKSVCRFCDSILKSLNELETHYTTNHNKVVRLFPRQQMKELNSFFCCSTCSKMSTSLTEHHAHMKNVHRMQIYVCKYCSFITSTSNGLETHVKQKHPEGTSADEDDRFSDEQKKLQVQLEFNETLNRKIDMSKINVDAMKPWIAKRVAGMLGETKDDVVTPLVFTQLKAEKYLDARTMQNYLNNFLDEKNTKEFMSALWPLLISAEESDDGIPAAVLELEKDEPRKRKFQFFYDFSNIFPN